MRELLMRNLKFKVIAILLAGLAWVYVNSVPYGGYNEPSFGVRERKVSLPVYYENLQSGLKVVEQTDRVELLVRESMQTVWSSEKLKAFVNLQEIKTEGRYFLVIETELPHWVKLIDQNPKYALVTVEEVKR